MKESQNSTASKYEVSVISAFILFVDYFTTCQYLDTLLGVERQVH
jgi:hypothetical protein